MFLGRIRNRRGVTLVFLAISITVLISMVALVVDLGQLYIAKQRAQNVADAAAIGGAWLLTGDEASQAPAENEAQVLTLANNSGTPNWHVRVADGATSPEGVIATVLPAGTTVTLGDGFYGNCWALSGDAGGWLGECELWVRADNGV
jgi:Flp pilus assembly protein TadG